MIRARAYSVMIFALITPLLLLGACSVVPDGKIKTSGTPKTGGDVSGKPTESAVSEDDHFMMVIDELLRVRRSMDASLPELRKSDGRVEGCVTYAPRNAIQFLSVYYECSKTDSEDGTRARFERKLIGKEVYSENDAGVKMQTAEETILSLRPVNSSTASSGLLTRSLEYAKPARGGDRSTQKILVEAKSDFKQDVAKERISEEWHITSTGNWRSPSGTVLWLEPRASIDMTYKPGTSAKSASVTRTLELTSETSISFSSNSNCVRPIGTFSYTMKLSSSNATTGVLVADLDGYLVTPTGGKTTEYAWPKRCLEN